MRSGRRSFLRLFPLAAAAQALPAVAGGEEAAPVGTCGMMGEVVGMAAALCARHDLSPRGVYEHRLDDLKALMAQGVGTGKPQPPKRYNMGG